MPNRADPGRRAFLVAVAAVGAAAIAGPTKWAFAAQGARVPLPSMGPSTRTTVQFASSESEGTIVVRKGERALYLVGRGGRALKYRVSVGREGFDWVGTAKVGAKKEWPEWRPPAEMRQRQADLPEYVPAGPYNPLGARALYLYIGGQDSLYRIHGTNDPGAVGIDGTSGCFRLTNTDVIDLYQRVSLGSKVIVE